MIALALILIVGAVIVWIALPLHHAKQRESGFGPTNVTERLRSTAPTRLVGMASELHEVWDSRRAGKLTQRRDRRSRTCLDRPPRLAAKVSDCLSITTGSAKDHRQHRDL